MILAITKAGYLNLIYLSAAVFFIFGLKMLSHVKTARQGNFISALGMLIAAVATFFYLTGGTLISLWWVGIALIIGTAAGLWMATTVKMTAMPQMVALLNGFGGIASLLVACGDYLTPLPSYPGAQADIMLTTGRVIVDQGSLFASWNTLLATALAVLIGGVTFTGSLVAYGKLEGLKVTPDQPVQFPGQKLAIAGAVFACLLFTWLIIANQGDNWLAHLALFFIIIVSLGLGIMLVIGIGGADMPVVIALLNSYSGLAASMAGFVLGNFCLIITGALVGASGIILTSIMCKAMNRSLMNVLFGGVGAAVISGTAQIQGEAKQSNCQDTSIILDASSQVMVVPGYGMAVAQAQHAVKELADELEKRNIKVRYAIHPVAGRMPGHMNVLLAEAGVPYEQLLDLDEANAEMERSDVALIIGANDVTNPAARHDQSSPIYGMPILDVDKAKTVFVIKRSLNPGFAGIQNELYFMDNTRMVFGDARKVVSELVKELVEL